MTQPEARNMLGDESSPYLRQHRDNPVHWRPWGRPALDEAKALKRPILLSVGYAACHWCHVMAHESFEDDEVAAVMNRLFVNIKVDREERPDIDQFYMAALSATGEQGGWPLTMFLTPDGSPFWGGTYFPKTARYGRPGFIEVLQAVASAWENKTEELEQGAATLKGHVASRLAPPSSTAQLDGRLLRSLAGSVYSAMDLQLGGLKGAPKFPNAPFMHVLWLDWRNSAEQAHRDAFLLTLRRMLSGGIYDHVGGGLCRYSTDDRWLVPHFEKMLYDNGQLIRMASWAFGETGDKLFRIRIEETVAWLQREMQMDGGAFASSLDADSEGHEGRFYLWTRAEIEETLGVELAAEFLQTYDLEAPPGWEDDPILHRLGHTELGVADTDPRLRDALAKLLERREKRVRPARDDKILVDWNGLLIAGLAGAGRVFQRDDWISLATKAFRFIAESKDDADRLPHSILGASRLYPCLSSDYAAMINAAASLFEATGDASYLAKASEWLALLDRWHGDTTSTGYNLSASDSDDVPVHIRGDIDEAIPSATSQIIEALVRLAMLSSDDTLYEKATTVAEHALGRIAGQPYGQAGVVYAAEIARQPRKLLIVEEIDQADGFVAAANRLPDPSRSDQWLPVGKEGEAKAVLPGGATIDTAAPGAWLCVGQSCLPPIREADLLAEALRPDPQSN